VRLRRRAALKAGGLSGQRAEANRGGERQGDDDVNGHRGDREIEGRLCWLHLLRDHLALTAEPWGCDTSNCGACAVWLDASR